MSLQEKISKCGHEIIIVSAEYPEPCHNYCCGHCPFRQESPCPKERKMGSIFDELAKF